ncbi:hypothetical protein [Actinomadura rupiterrae]|uniref:hypothetical protein n=1 Tax=Actinomadura rupiterrae TaxID=559627 RepID=UPI0020A3F21F|nr:hypothetical protein [Actinomadura rupiterrae]MCP2342128.1 hypothetical protein [Actinomadura rupiterrae]
MSKIFLILHVLAAVIAVGPITVAGSMFPAAARKAAAGAERPEALAAVRLLHRICRVYAVVGLAVPVLGFATASSMHIFRSPWLMVSIALTGVAALVLALLVLPAQESAIAALTSGASGADGVSAAARRDASGAAAVARLDSGQVRRLAMLTGLFNLLWAAVTILMIVRPGSTTGA